MFTGFTDATVDFLWGIRFNNERPWFEAHKETYLSELYRPMKDLGAEIYEFLSERLSLIHIFVMLRQRSCRSQPWCKADDGPDVSGNPSWDCT